MPPHKKQPLSTIKLPAIRTNIIKQTQLMGCASSQAAEIKAQNQNVIEPTAPPPQNENEDTAKENNNDESKTNENTEENSENSGITKYPPAEAFEIPLDNLISSPSLDADGNSLDPLSGGGGESLIKRHPPKRLQRLVEQSQQSAESATQATIEDLEEKLAKAELRRQKFLQQRVETVLSLAQPQIAPPSFTEVTRNNVDILTISGNNDDVNVLKNDEINSKEIPNVNKSTRAGTPIPPAADNNEDENKDVIDNDDDESNSTSINNNNRINHSSDIRNYTRPPTTATKIVTVKDTINKDEKYRSPGDGDEHKEENPEKI